VPCERRRAQARLAGEGVPCVVVGKRNVCGGAPYDAGATEAQRTVGVSHRAVDEVDGLQENDAPVEGRRSPVIVNVRLEATAAAGEAGRCRCVARSVWLRVQ
jgi:hypothetical protein